MAIQMPPLHTTLVELHQQLAKITREAKEIVIVYKRTPKVSEQMHTEWSAVKQTNKELTARLQQVETKLKEAGERLQTTES